jgi:hypothetical protein
LHFKGISLKIGEKTQTRGEGVISDMQEWADIVNYQVTELAKMDSDFQERLAACGRLEPAYLALLQRLCPEDRQLLEAYIGACEDKENRFAQLAYQFGKNRL